VLRAAPADNTRLVVHVSIANDYLEIRDGEKLIACFPVTPGSTAIPTPKGEWHVEEKTLLPEFRWDESMLKSGVRSNNFFQLPPGPNNPVGIAWIALNKPGIGIHGTSDPDSIGRSASHGCIRLSNWDAFKVYGIVAKGTKVIIE
jgi:lipoprotein-anchoring transpeptidase ErfK/SrfK